MEPKKCHDREYVTVIPVTTTQTATCFVTDMDSVARMTPVCVMKATRETTARNSTVQVRYMVENFEHFSHSVLI